jgi:hypothetical protein
MRCELLYAGQGQASKRQWESAKKMDRWLAMAGMEGQRTGIEVRVALLALAGHLPLLPLAGQAAAAQARAGCSALDASVPKVR